MNLGSTPETIELELKLGVRNCDVSAVNLALTSVLKRVTDMSTASLNNFYFDHEGRLLELGIAIRIRSVGDLHEMTVKVRESDKGGLSQRREWNFLIDEQRLQYDRLRNLPLSEPVLHLLRQEKLGIVFENRVERTDWLIEMDKCVVMMSLDLGSVRAGSQHSPVSELEFELVSGDVGQLVELGCDVSDRLPSFMAVISKAERGDRLIRHAHPMCDPSAKNKREWLLWLSRALDSLSGPNEVEAVKALEAIKDRSAEARFITGLNRGELPAGLARWMIKYSLETDNEPG